MKGEKILTLSIAAYNSENFIRNTLNSIIDESIIDNIEVFIIDDGGTDHTLEISQEYADRYPNSIFPIHKENGGYGSTIDYSIEHANGKYFKLLDGDDWFAMDQFVSYIKNLPGIDPDIIVTPYMRCRENETPEIVDTIDGYPLDIDLTISDMPIRRTFGMWALTYKTEILRRCGMTLPSHCLYTDQIYSIIPFSAAATIRFMNYNIYCYRIGEDGQSVSRESRIKHVDDNIRATQILCDFYEEQKLKGNTNLPYLFKATALISRTVIKTYLLEPASVKTLSEISDYDKWLKENAIDIYKGTGDTSVCGKTGLLVKVFRLVHYGRIGVLICKICLPKRGIDNWT